MAELNILIQLPQQRPGQILRPNRTLLERTGTKKVDWIDDRENRTESQIGAKESAQNLIVKAIAGVTL